MTSSSSTTTTLLVLLQTLAIAKSLHPSAIPNPSSSLPSAPIQHSQGFASADAEKSQVSVFDNVVPSSLCNELHSAASKAGLGHRAFTRPLVQGKGRGQDQTQATLIERVLDSILTEMGDVVTGSGAGAGAGAGTSDNKQYVEYWTRQEWRHIEAHADVDENLAKEQDASEGSSSDEELPFRYPKNGHVLYLKIGSDVSGPTCVFPSRSSGGDLHKSSQNVGSGEGDAGSGDVELVTVPAVEGRLLRFEGSLLHAVPRPADLWFLSFVKGAPQFTPEEQWGRSVILFNTWSGEEGGPPKGVPLDESLNHDDPVPNSSGGGSDGYGDSVDGDSGGGSWVNKRNDWHTTFSLAPPVIADSTTTTGDDLHCSEKDSTTTTTDEITFGKPAKVWLLGNTRRRNYPMRTIKLKAPIEARDAFLEHYDVSRITLQQQ